jgi:hypothetical protein
MSSIPLWERFVAAAALGAAAAAALADTAEPAPPADLTEIQVTARRLDAAHNQLMPDVGASEYRLGADDLKNLSLGDSTPLNQVLLQAQGVVQDAFGKLISVGTMRMSNIGSTTSPSPSR